MSKRIMCFGDSLTWGWIPMAEGVPTERYPFQTRWTGQMMAALGDGYEVVEEGLSGRTTNVDDPTDPRLNGAEYLPSALATHLPLDLVIIMVGTNDTKSHLHRTPFDIAAGMSILLGQIATSAGGVGTSYPAPATLLLAPPPVADRPNPWFAELFADGPAKSAELGRLYKALAEFMGVGFLDVGQLITTDGVDGIHWTPENNEVVGKAVAEKVREILG
ncbi:MAG: SGNH/GDSL hydrolase family protein [Brooklawnia sp.]